MSTAYGLSEHTNCFNRIAPVFGIGQGASDGPPGWGAIIDIVLKVYAKLAKGCKIKQIQHQGVTSLKTNTNAFVDNTRLLLTEIQRKEGNPPEIETTIGADTLKSTYKNWAEKASTSPSGRHLGLYKAWLKVPEENK